jgi:cell wall-associated NlpC family hydrolase
VDYETGYDPSLPQSKEGQALAKIVCQRAWANVPGRYVWGGTAFKACDCSGLVIQCYKYADPVQFAFLDRMHYTGYQVKFGTTVSFNEMLPGDVVFFYSDISHVGIYVGKDPSPGRPVMVHASDYSVGIISSYLDTRRGSIYTIKRYLK